jgi:hypothetical protein
MQGKVLGFGSSSLLQVQGLPTSCRKVVGSVKTADWMDNRSSLRRVGGAKDYILNITQWCSNIMRSLVEWLQDGAKFSEKFGCPMLSSSFYFFLEIVAEQWTKSTLFIMSRWLLKQHFLAQLPTSCISVLLWHSASLFWLWNLMFASRCLGVRLSVPLCRPLSALCLGPCLLICTGTFKDEMKVTVISLFHFEEAIDFVCWL